MNIEEADRCSANQDSPQEDATPLVSVVVPAYNAAATIAEMITSVLAQSVADLEIVICNDASTDETAACVSKFEDVRVRVLHNEANAGEGKSRDRAIRAARGKWIAVLDADDAWLPDRLARLLQAAGDDGDIMVFDNIMVCHHTAGGLVPWAPMRPPTAFGASDGAPRDVPFPDYIRSDRLLIKPLIPRQRLLESGVRHSTRKFAADSEFFLRLGIAGLRFRYVPEALYLYRVMPGSATAVAGGWHLMRECLEGVARQDGISPPVASALRSKIESLRGHEQLYALVHALRGFHLGAAFGILARNPGLLTYSPRFMFKRIRYQLHRVRHAGHRR